MIELEEEEFKLPEFAELLNLETWCHTYPFLLKCGRSDYFVDNSIPEEERDAKLEIMKEEDPEVPRLRGITEDEPYPNFESSWIARSFEEPQVYNGVDKDDGKALCYSVARLASLYWPGAYLVCKGENFSNIYVGYGLKPL